jgi:hypothetical protein
MSSIVDPHPEQPAADELVAYLDGELPPDDCRRVEERLAADADYRQQLRDLDQAWEALDALPTRKTNDDFARTTMELVAVAAQADASVVTESAAKARRRRMIWFTTAALAGCLLGFVAAWLLLPNRNLTLLHDLPVIRQVDVLRQVESADFLRRLAAEVPEERLMNDEAAIHDELAQLKLVGSESFEERRKWVEGLSPEDKVVLAAQAKRFNERIPEQERLRALQQEISSGGLELQRTLLAYDQWLARLTAAQQEELRENLLDLNVEEQVELVSRLVRQEQEQASRRLTPEDAEKLRTVLKEITTERQAEIMADSRRRGDKGRTRRPEGGALPILARELFKGEDNNQIRERLVSQLSPDARAHLDSLSRMKRTGQLWRWILDSLQEKVDSDELERFFADKLTNDQREQLLSLPPNEMQSRLERLYYATELGYSNAAQWSFEYRESGGGPPNRFGPDRPDFRQDGTRDRRRPDDPPGGPPPEFGRRGRGPGPGGPGGPHPPREDEFPDDRRPSYRQGPPPDEPPPGGPPPRDGDVQQQEI